MPVARREVCPDIRAGRLPEGSADIRTESSSDPWRSLTIDDGMAMMPLQPWNNPLLLQEEFILMNDLHRRDSTQLNYPVLAF